MSIPFVLIIQLNQSFYLCILPLSIYSCFFCKFIYIFFNYFFKSMTIELLQAIRQNHLKAVKELIFLGVSVQKQERMKRSPLHEAVITKNFEIAKLLLETGARVNEYDNLRKSALHYAAFLKDTKMINLLLSFKCNVNQKDKRGNTALIIAITKKSKASVQALLDGGADKTVVNRLGLSAKDVATKVNHKPIIDLFQD